ncbi:MAG: DNA-directed RNA polymerase subunit beta' [Chloroflexota bacterium]|nr:DNA-directed RNA polymerase subunit beta' [Chloroflexota bacterium]
MLEVNDFSAVRISLASPEQIRSWSWGEVTKPETVNYRTLKPERDGLFCERIFGPTKDFECYCGKYKKVRYRGIICDKCGVEVARARVRRERMGHIELAAPVSHIWFVKGTPSVLGLLLDISPRNLERVLYFSQYIITKVNEAAREAEISRLREKLAEVGAAEADTSEAAEEKQKGWEEINSKIDELEEISPMTLLSDNRHRDLHDRYPGVFKDGMGAEAILDILAQLELVEHSESLYKETKSSTGQRRKKAIKRLKVVEALRRSGNKPEWMILTVLPVLPPDLRPMVQLDGGRFATSDLNDLYRRAINRNNRLRRLLDLGAPEIIIRNEKRMLQEAIDSLIDNGRRGRAITSAGNHKLKSLSDMLRGKQGRFRQNLLGKRVDYSGRSVIVVGPELKLHQCGLPKRMALELFKPFVMHHLIIQGYAHNIKSAKRLVERERPEVWDALTVVMKERPVLLNRAPTLHRLGIQAFEPVLIDGSAIQIHPLVCTAFNADFDGDQMAVHVPLSKAAILEAREVMLASRNMLLPSSGEPVVDATLDIVLGCYYLTMLKPGVKGEGMMFSSFEEAKLAYDMRVISLGAEIEVRDDEGERIKTTVGRIIFNEVLPEEMRFMNRTADKGVLKRLVADCYKMLGSERAAELADDIKRLGFRYATRSGSSIAIHDMQSPDSKPEILEDVEKRVIEVDRQFQKGLITEDERYSNTVRLWSEATDRISQAIEESLDRYGSIYLMVTSGAKGNIAQIRQMAGMRGLMADPSGRVIDLPIRSSFREGLTALEYFISTHGARKGLADTALRTADSGYLTRRLVDVAQDLIVLEEDCGTTAGMWIVMDSGRRILAPFEERLVGRYAAAAVFHPKTRSIIVERNQEIDEDIAAEIAQADIHSVYVRSPLTCQLRHGICQMCYGRSLAHGTLVRMGEAVGIIAAQSIGEPGTQLTLRTFHTGGVAGMDIISGLPRVEELFEARTPKVQAVISEIDGKVQVMEDDEERKIRVESAETYRDEYSLPPEWKANVASGQWVDIGEVLAEPEDISKALIAEATPPIARVAGVVGVEGDLISISYEEREEREYHVPAASHIAVESGGLVRAGQQLTEGFLNPQDLLRILGREAVQQYLVDEVQQVYRSQGVAINDKHIETIVRQMLRKVRIDVPGDTELLPGELVDRFTYEDINAKVLAEGGEPATAQPVLLGITKASLNTSSFLSAASFQETTRVLTEAAVSGKTDKLLGLKENVIIGKLIPARCSLSLEAQAMLAPPPPMMMDEMSFEGALDAALEEELARSELVLGAEEEQAGEEESPSEQPIGDDVSGDQSPDG